MYKEALKELEEISKYAGTRQEYVQGGGGNASVKLDDNLMAIKASGCRLADVTPESGFAAVNYQSILKYHSDTPKGTSGRDYNKEVMEAATASIQQVNGETVKRPSVETGFHALLGRCVLHTHSAYINVLMCSDTGQKTAEGLFKNAGINYAFIPYETPGYYLTEKIRAISDTAKSFPEVILLGNHGIVVQAEDAARCISVHEAVNMMVKSKLTLPDFPACAVKRYGGGYASATPWLLERTGNTELMEAAFSAPLYPDQLVYLGGCGTGKKGGKIIINEGEIVYNSGEAEARAMEETLCGAVYVIDCIQKPGWKLKLMSREAVSYISNWDSEAYRKKQMTQE